MNQEEKLAALEEIMELDEGELKPDMALEEIEEWDSLAALSYVVLMTDEFNKKISGAEIRAFQTVRDILDTME
jgi:acyl carrier protein